MNGRPVTLQISLAPSDYRHARLLLPHQIAAWRPQVDELLLTIDFHRSPGRFSERWEEGKAAIGDLARSVAGARVLEVDYGAEARRRVAAEFFGGAPIPEKDFRGGPFYSYFFGLNAATHDRILHADSDMFFGGRSAGWLAEADALMDRREDVIVAGPHPGPPASDGQVIAPGAVPYPGVERGFRFSQMSSRLFYFRRSRFSSHLGELRAARPPAWRDRVKAWVEGNACADLPEHLFSREMARQRLCRVEFLGSAPGMWSLHPPYRSADFYARLPELIRAVETGDVPSGQRGDHDLNEHMVDWSEARTLLRTNRWWRRLAQRAAGKK